MAAADRVTSIHLTDVVDLQGLPILRSFEGFYVRSLGTELLQIADTMCFWIKGASPVTFSLRRVLLPMLFLWRTTRPGG